MSQDCLCKQGSCWIDVRSAAEAHVTHVQSLVSEKAGGKRIIVSTGSYVWQDWIDVTRSITPPPILSSRFAPGYPDLKSQPLVRYNTANEAEILGIKHRTAEEMTKDTLAEFYRRGW